jgi:hypothetical protein
MTRRGHPDEWKQDDCLECSLSAIELVPKFPLSSSTLKSIPLVSRCGLGCWPPCKEFAWSRTFCKSLGPAAETTRPLIARTSMVCEVSPWCPPRIALAACSLRAELISATALDIARSISTISSMISAIRADLHAARDHKRALQRSARQGCDFYKSTLLELFQ